jgi:hypothetical protein
MLLSLSGVPDLGSRSAKPPLKPTQPSVVVKTASKDAISIKPSIAYQIIDAGMVERCEITTSVGAVVAWYRPAAQHGEEAQTTAS